MKRVVDVRAVAWSQRPQYRKTAFAEALSNRGIEYVHCKVAGNPFRSMAGQAGTFKDCEASYTRHLAEHPEIVEAVVSLLRGVVAVLLCYERDRLQCHRGVLLKAITERSSIWRVVDL